MLYSTATTNLAVDYLLTNNDQSLAGIKRHQESFADLKKICQKACRGLYLPGKPFSQRRQDVDHDKGNWNSGQRDVEDFIEMWLLQKLALHWGRTESEIRAAAENDEFRYLGRQCRNALLDEIDKLSAQKRTSVEVSLDAPISPQHEDVTWHHKLVVSSDASALGETQVQQDDLYRLLQERKQELTALLDDRLFSVLEAYVSVYPDSDKGAITRAISDKNGINERQAQENKKQLRAILQRAFAEANRTAIELVELLRSKPMVTTAVLRQSIRTI